MSADPIIGKVVAGHRVESFVGKGGMSVVYLAHHLRLGRKRALKLLSTSLAEDAEARARFEEEWQLAASIEHAAIVEVFDAGEFDGQLYIIMRYVEGGDLKVLLEKEGPLEPARALTILEPIASALDSAHERGLVHRDIKPANILIGPRDRSYLSDFGIAKLSASPKQLTKAGHFVGTVDYSAPEQIEDREVDARTDVYSLACVLYHCLTGTPPYARESEAQTMLAHLLEPPPSMTSTRPDLPSALDAVVGKAMSKHKEDRHPTCGELVTAAGQAVAAPAAETASGTRLAETPPGGTRLAGTPAGGVAETKLRPGPPAREAPITQPAPPPPLPRKRLLVAGLGGIAGFAVLAGIGAAIWFLALRPSSSPAKPPTPVDQTPPRAVSAAVAEDGVLTVSFDDSLDETSVPSPGVFTVRAQSRRAGGVQTVSVTGSSLSLRLAGPLRGPATLDYDPPAARPLQDRNGNRVAAFAGLSVATPQRGDTEAPTLYSGVVKDDTLRLNFSEELDASSVPPGNAFRTAIEGTERGAPRSVAVEGASVLLDLSYILKSGRSRVTVDYRGSGAGSIRDLAENQAAVFRGFAVKNNTFTPGRPSFLAEVCGNFEAGRCLDKSACCPFVRGRNVRFFKFVLMQTNVVAGDRIVITLKDRSTGFPYIRKPFELRPDPNSSQPKETYVATITGGPFSPTTLDVTVKYNGNRLEFRDPLVIEIR